MTSNDKTAYICGPLTELSVEDQSHVKGFYARIADAYKKVFGVRAFVPHEHYDPVLHKDFLPEQVDDAERYQICNKTTVLIVVAIAPSWGGGIEVEMANNSGVPVILIFPYGKRVSRLLRGNPAVRDILEYNVEEAVISAIMLRISNHCDLLPV